MEFLTDPWSWWVEPFAENPFMQRALAAGLLAVVCTAVVGTWVVLRGMAFLGDAVAHGVLPGIAIAFVLGFSTTVGAFLAALAMVAGVNLLRVHAPLPDDTSIGVLFVGFLALAVVIMSTEAAGGSGDLNRFLFGSITGVDNADLARQFGAAVVTLGGVALFYRSFLVSTFSETQAQLLGLRPRVAHAMLLVLLTIAIVTSFEAVGSLLVFAFLVAPAAAAALIARRVPMIMLTAVVLGSVSVVVGLLISYHQDTAASATMALTSVVLFLLVVTAITIRRGLRGTRLDTVPVPAAGE